MRGEVVVAVRGGGRHSHRGHSLLLRNGRLALLVRPVATDGTRAEPLAIHRAERLLRITAFTEGDETVTTRATSLHIPHDARFRNGAKGGESLEKNLIIDLVRQVADEDMEVVRRVFLGLVVRLVGPVDANFLVQRLLKTGSYGRLGDLRSGERDGRSGSA